MSKIPLTPRGSVPAVVLALTLFAATAFGAGMVGEVAADFTLDALAGGTVTMSDYAGQVVFLQVIGYG